MEPDELDGVKWSSPTTKRAKSSPTVEKKLKRRVSESSNRGRPTLVYDDNENSVKAQKLGEFNDKMRRAIEKVLAAEEDQTLVAAWRERYYPTEHDADPESLLSLNVKEFYESLPKSSLIKTVLIKDLYKGYTQKEICALLDLSQSRVSKALNTETKALSYYLSSLGIPRNRCVLAEMYVLNWFSIACQVPSGRNRRCFVGTAVSMYFEYRTWCLQCEVRFTCLSLVSLCSLSTFPQ